MSRSLHLRLLGLAAAAVVTAAALPATAGALVATGPAGWSWSSPQPVGGNLSAVAFGPTRGYAVGTSGTFLRTDDGGATWTGLTTGTTDALRFVQALGDDTVFAAGACNVLRTDDGGRTVRTLRLPGSSPSGNCAVPPISGLSFVSARVGFILLQDGTLLRTDDGGATFARRTSVPLAGGPAAGIAFADPSLGVAIGGTAQGAILRTTDGGGSWTTVYAGTPAVNAVSWIDATHLVATGNGLVVTSSDGGATWTPSPVAVAGVTPNLTGASCTAVDACLMTTDNGRAVIRLAGTQVSAVAPASRAVHGLGRTAAGRIVGVGDGGTVVVSDDGAKTFATAGSSLPAGLTGLRPGPSGSMLALGSGGFYAVTADAGRTWIPGSAPTAAPLADASFPTSHVGYVLGQDGGLLRTDNSGATWSVLDPGSLVRSLAVFAPDDRTVVLGSTRGLRRSLDGGATFAPVAGLGRSPSVVRITAAGSAVLARGSALLAMSTDAGKSWRTLPRPTRSVLRDASFASSRAGWVLDGSGHVWHTGDRGRTWAIQVGTGPWWPTAVAAVSPREAFLSIRNFAMASGLWTLHTTDGGRSWNPQSLSRDVPAPTELTSLAVGGRAAYALRVDGPVFVAPDGGDGPRTRSTLSLKASTTRLRRAGVVRITGRLSPAAGGEHVAVDLRIAGRGTWRQLILTAASDGRFSFTRRYSQTTDVVAQWAGDTTRTGDGTSPLRIRIAR